MLIRTLAAAGRFEESLALLAGISPASWKNAALDIAMEAASTRPDIAGDLYRQVIAELEHRGTKPAMKELVTVQALLDAVASTTG